MGKKRIATIYHYSLFSKAVCSSGKSCSNCPLGIRNNKQNMNCFELLEECPDKYSEILLKWIDEHPIKTYMDDFIEKFPNVKKSEAGDFLLVCRKNIYGGECNHCKCSECWNQLYLENETSRR